MMKTRVFTMMCLLAMCAFASRAEIIKGNGQIITKAVNVSDYHEIEISGNISCSPDIQKILSIIITPTISVILTAILM